MNIFDLGLVWSWEYDADFIRLVGQICRSRQLLMVQVVPENLDQILSDLGTQQMVIHAFLDRASEGDSRFKPLVRWVTEHKIFCINRYEQAALSCNKAEMHYTLIHAGLYTPYTIILPSYEEQPEISNIDLHLLGRKFIIKPAHGGGGEGVVTEATSLKQVLVARQDHRNDKYLLQAYIVPRKLDSRSAWFRILYCGGRVYPCWWNPHTKIYAPVTYQDEELYHLKPLRDHTLTIARLGGLNLFSTEIALTAEGLFVVIDYVNDQPDLRLQSKALDGVPDYIVEDVARCIVDLAMNRTGSVLPDGGV
jgi:hypothetical protein